MAVHSVFVVPIDSASPDVVRIFVAASADEWLPAKVLEFSIRERASREIEFASIASFGRSIPQPLHRRSQPRTPFSFQRFLIPELCAYRGRAIYLDADMQAFADIADVWGLPMNDNDLLTVAASGAGRAEQNSVMLLDCERLAWRIEDIVEALNDGRYSYEQLLHGMCVAEHIARTIPRGWNSLEHYDASDTRLLHYTDMNTHPWVTTSNPLCHFWVACLRRALDSGFITRDEVQREVTASRVRPSLLSQMDSTHDDPRALSLAIRRMDRGFTAPYQRLPSVGQRPWAPLATLAHRVRQWW